MASNIIQAIEAAYRSAERPDWSFVTKRMKEGLYDDFIKQLGGLGSIVETTDQNDDCSRCLSIISGVQLLTLKLSFVCKFVCIHDADGHFFSGSDLLSNALGEKLLRLLQDYGLELIDEKVLRTEATLGGQKYFLYELLFSSDGLIS